MGARWERLTLLRLKHGIDGLRTTIGSTGLGSLT